MEEKRNLLVISLALAPVLMQTARLTLQLPQVQKLNLDQIQLMAQLLMLKEPQLHHLLPIKDQLANPLQLLVIHLTLMILTEIKPKVQVTSILASNMTISTMDGMKKTNSRFEVKKKI